MDKRRIGPNLSPEQPDFEKQPVNQPEILISPENKEGEEDFVFKKEKKESAGEIVQSSSPTPISKAPFVLKEKSEVLKEIESILSEGLEEPYQSLPDNLKKDFKQKGEETASKIEELVNQAKIMVHKIVDLIKNWLCIIPGVNKFFLEQETKIKTGKILMLAEKRKQIK